MKLNSFILSLVVLLALSSCEGFIEVDQPDVVEQEQAFSDANSTRLAIIGLYGLMADLVEPMFLASEVRADLVVATASADSYIKEYSNNSFSPSNPYISSKPFYTLINNVNDFIYEFEQLVEANEMDSVDFVKYKSELVGIRVWTQLQIARTYGHCKYYKHILGSSKDEQVLDLPFDNRLLDSLISDLSFSDNVVFTEQTGDVIWQVVRMNDFYINFLMGELLLERGLYDDAYDKFDEILRRGDLNNRKAWAARFSLYEDFYDNDWMLELFDEEWEPTRLLDHAVFMIAFDNKYNQTNDLWNWTLSLDYQVAPADWYTDEFTSYVTSDVSNFDSRYYSIYTPSLSNRQFSIAKYAENDRPYILARTGRIELLKAYCQAAEGDDRGVLSRLDNIRERLGLPEIDENLVPTDEEEMIIWLEDAVLTEFAYETGFEGYRWYDLMRVAKRRDDPAYLAEKVAQKYPEEARADMIEKLSDPANWYIPDFE